MHFLRQKLDFLEFSWPWDTCTNKIIMPPILVTTNRTFIISNQRLFTVQVRSGVRISRVNTSHFAQHRAGVFELLKCVELKEFTEAQMKTVTDQVRL